MTGTQTIDPSATMAELLEAFPGAQRALFRRYHIGGCASCGFSPEETLEGVCARNGGIDPEEALEWITHCEEQERQMRISPAELKQLLDENTPPRVLDIRSAEEFEAAKIDGAQRLTQQLMQEALAKWPKDELLVLIDHAGARGMDAAAFFAGHGFENVKALSGGINAYAEEADPSIPRYEIER